MKKLIALTLCLMSIMLILCSCKPKAPETNSSTPTENESSMIENDTSSKGFSETETSSIAEEEEPWDEEEEPWDEEEEEESSKNYKPIDRNPSLPATTSSSLKLPDIDGSTMEIGCFQFAPMYTNDYKEKYQATNLGSGVTAKSIEQFEDTIAEGYFNTVMLTTADFAIEEVWQVLEKYKMKVWLLTGGCYDSSSGKTVDEFFEEGWLKTLSFIKDNPKRWEMFNGFAYDEIVHRGFSPEDFSLTMEYAYKKLGKRNFPVMAPQECTKLWWGGEQQQTTEGCKYVTDIAFDMYAGDVRTDSGNNVASYAKGVYPEYNIKNDKDVYRMMTSEMLKLVGRPVTVWYYPSSHMMADYHTEEYCLAQLKFFEQLLKEQDHPGGIILFTYAQPNETLYSLQSFLDLGENNEKSIRIRYENKIWKDYSAYLKDLTMRYRNTKNNPTIDLGV